MSNIRKFELVRNGYDVSQVDSEIERLQKQIEVLNQKILTYQNQIETIGSQFSTIRQRYQSIVSELNMREKAADDVARIALKEANSIIESAQVNADNIIEEAIFNARKLLNEVSQYNTESVTMQKQLKDRMQEFIELLDRYETVSLPEVDFDKFKE